MKPSFIRVSFVSYNDGGQAAAILNDGRQQMDEFRRMNAPQQYIGLDKQYIGLDKKMVRLHRMRQN